jgi:hypothetical protein
MADPERGEQRVRTAPSSSEGCSEVPGCDAIRSEMIHFASTRPRFWRRVVTLLGIVTLCTGCVPGPRHERAVLVITRATARLRCADSLSHYSYTTQWVPRAVTKFVPAATGLAAW